MTKEQMMEKYYFSDGNANYEEAQRRIMREMIRGQKYVYLPGKFNPDQFVDAIFY